MQKKKMLIAPSSSIKELSDGFNLSLGDQCVHIPALVPLWKHLNGAFCNQPSLKQQL